MASQIRIVESDKFDSSILENPHRNRRNDDLIGDESHEHARILIFIGDWAARFQEKLISAPKNVNYCSATSHVKSESPGRCLGDCLGARRLSVAGQRSPRDR